MLEISFEKRNARLDGGPWIFARAHTKPFEWFALLAYRRATSHGETARVSLAEIARLPSWRETAERHLGTYIGRYLQALDQAEPRLVRSRLRWAGPYELALPPSAIRFDLPLPAVRKRLGIRPEPLPVAQSELLAFTKTYMRAQYLLFRGRLLKTAERGFLEDSAYDLFFGMAADSHLRARLRLIACLASVRVLFRLGKFEAALKVLKEFANVVRKAHDEVLTSQYHLALAWCNQRAASGPLADRATERELNKARASAERSSDRAALGLLAYRWSGYLTKKGQHEKSIAQMLLAVEAAIVTGGFDVLHSYCTDLGSVTHRLGLEYYDTAREWLLLGIAIARRFRIGRDDAHGEMILAKIHIEQGQRPILAKSLLSRAERIARGAGNSVNLGDIKVVWGFWHQAFGTSRRQVQTLVEVIRVFSHIHNFDLAQKEAYMARKFPGVWPEVMAKVRSK